MDNLYLPLLGTQRTRRAQTIGHRLYNRSSNRNRCYRRISCRSGQPRDHRAVLGHRLAGRTKAAVPYAVIDPLCASAPALQAEIRTRAALSFGTVPSGCKRLRLQRRVLHLRISCRGSRRAALGQGSCKPAHRDQGRFPCPPAPRACALRRHAVGNTLRGNAVRSLR